MVLEQSSCMVCNLTTLFFGEIPVFIMLTLCRDLKAAYYAQIYAATIFSSLSLCLDWKYIKAAQKENPGLCLLRFCNPCNSTSLVVVGGVKCTASANYVESVAKCDNCLTWEGSSPPPPPLPLRPKVIAGSEFSYRAH